MDHVCPFTAAKLRSCDPQHLNRVSHRTFIGPVPKNWNLRDPKKYGVISSKYYGRRGFNREQVPYFSKNLETSKITRLDSENSSPTTQRSTITENIKDDSIIAHVEPEDKSNVQLKINSNLQLDNTGDVRSYNNSDSLKIIPSTVPESSSKHSDKEESNDITTDNNTKLEPADTIVKWNGSVGPQRPFLKQHSDIEYSLQNDPMYAAVEGPLTSIKDDSQSIESGIDGTGKPLYRAGTESQTRSDDNSQGVLTKIPSSHKTHSSGQREVHERKGPDKSENVTIKEDVNDKESYEDRKISNMASGSLATRSKSNSIRMDLSVPVKSHDISIFARMTQPKFALLRNSKQLIGPKFLHFNCVLPYRRFDAQKYLKHAREGHNFDYIEDDLQIAKTSNQLLFAESMLVKIEASHSNLRPSQVKNAHEGFIKTREKFGLMEVIVALRVGKSPEVPLIFTFHRIRKFTKEAYESFKENKYFEKLEICRKHVFIQFTSHIDKTLLLSEIKDKSGRLFYLKSRMRSSAFFLYDILKQCMGYNLPTVTPISIPDFDLTLFLNLNNRTLLRLQFEDENASYKDYQASFLKNDLPFVEQMVILDCLDDLSDFGEWSSIVEHWKKFQKVGLCWRFFDILEWNENLLGSIIFSHWVPETFYILELRPKTHYPTTVHEQLASPALEEPAPVEGFLSRRTTARGKYSAWGRVFVKNFYVFSQGHFLFFSKPRKACLPDPRIVAAKKLGLGGEETDRYDTNYLSIEPYPLKEGEISWYKPQYSSFLLEARDELSREEFQRKKLQIRHSTGFIDMLEIVKGVICTDSTSTRIQGTNENRDQSNDCGDDFEIQMTNGLRIIYRAHSSREAMLWVRHINRLVTYWKLRKAADVKNFRQMKENNLRSLQIDEEMESTAYKNGSRWEWKSCQSDPEIFHYCNISDCRPIHMDGCLYYKSEFRSAFHIRYVLLTTDHLILFEKYRRSGWGKAIRSVQHVQKRCISLRNMFVYSGQTVQKELRKLARDSSSTLGLSALPRRYPSGVTTISDPTDTVFAVWLAPQQYSAIRTLENGRNKHKKRATFVSTSRLGVHGQSIFFVANSRQERDQWVTILNTCIERINTHDIYN